MDTKEYQQLANSLQGALTNCDQTIGGRTFSPSNWTYTYPSCSHGQDEDLILKAIQRCPDLKKKLLKLALEEVLRSLK